MVCAGSVALSKDLPNPSSKYADEGTLAHALAAKCLIDGTDASGWVGAVVPGDDSATIIQTEMAAYVQVYLDNVRERIKGGELQVEQKVDFSTWVQHKDQKGTADALILSADGSHLTVVDLKYGRGVQVEAEENEQLMLYALGSLDRYELVADIQHVTLEIHQPRLEHLSSWTVPLAHLHEFAQRASKAVSNALDVVAIIEGGGSVKATDLVDGDHCRFCRAKAICPKLLATVEENLGQPLAAVSQFDDLTKSPLEKLSDYSLDNLAQAMRSVSLVEQWCSAVRAETESRLLGGVAVEGWKLVQGKKGNRAWIDEAAAEKYLAGAFKHDEIYKKVLLSPTVILDPKRGPKLGPRQLKTVQGMVMQSEGRPSVAPESDKRPALVLASAEHFEAIPADEDLF